MITSIPNARKLTNAETILLHSMSRELATCMYEQQDIEFSEILSGAPEFSRMEYDEKIVALYHVCEMAQSDTRHPPMLWVDATLYAVLQFTDQEIHADLSLNIPLLGIEKDGSALLGTMLINALLSHVRTIESMEKFSDLADFERDLLKAHRRNPKQIKISNKSLRKLATVLKEDWFEDYDYMTGDEMTAMPGLQYRELSQQLGIDPSFHFETAPACPPAVVKAGFKYFDIPPPKRRKS